jgi:catechol 2,3-dioxygenase-like lactoylglutathione lyase family enzyme
MRTLGIDHIGIASADLGRHIEIFGDKPGLEIHDIHEKDPYDGLRAAFARVGDTDFELLEDRVPDGDQKVIDQRDIARFVSRRGKGERPVLCPSAMRRATAAWRSGGGETSSYPGPPSPSPSSRSEERERAVSSPDRAGCADRC